MADRSVAARGPSISRPGPGLHNHARRISASDGKRSDAARPVSSCTTSTRMPSSTRDGGAVTSHVRPFSLNLDLSGCHHASFASLM